MLMTACSNKEAIQDDATQDVQPTKIENVAEQARRDSLARESSIAQNKVDFNSREISELEEQQKNLYALAAKEYWKKLDEKYPVTKFLSADEMKYFSALAKKIQQNPDALEYGAEALDFEDALAGGYSDGGTRYSMDAVRINPMESVGRIAAGRGALRDLEVMVSSTTFGFILNKGEMKELGKHISFSSYHSSNSLCGAGALGEAWAKQRYEYLSANMSFAVSQSELQRGTEIGREMVDAGMKSSELERRVENSDFESLAERDAAMADLAHAQDEYTALRDKFDKMRADILKASGYKGDEVDWAVGGPNYQIPEMQKIRAQYDELQQKIDNLVAQRDSTLHVIGDIRSQMDR